MGSLHQHMMIYHQFIIQHCQYSLQVGMCNLIPARGFHQIRWQCPPPPSTYSGHVTEESKGPKDGKGEAVSGLEMQEYDGKKSLLSKASVGKVIQRVVRIGGYRQISKPKTEIATANGSELVQQAFGNFPDDRRSKFKGHVFLNHLQLCQKI